MGDNVSAGKAWVKTILSDRVRTLEEKLGVAEEARDGWRERAAATTADWVDERYRLIQILGRAMGLPRAHPDVPELDGCDQVDTGEHTVDSLAAALSLRLGELERDLYAAQTNARIRGEERDAARDAARDVSGDGPVSCTGNHIETGNRDAAPAGGSEDA
jgi:hypothetical protein